MPLSDFGFLDYLVVPVVEAAQFINSQPAGSKFNFLHDTVYLLDRDINPKSRQRFNLNGATIKARDAITTTVDGILLSSATTITVANASDFSVGQDIAVSQSIGVDAYNATFSTRRIVAINGNQIQIDRAFPLRNWANANAMANTITQLDSANGVINFFTSATLFEHRNAAGRIGANGQGNFNRISHVTIKDGTLDGNEVNNPHLRRWELQANIDLGCDNLTLENLEIINARSDAITVSGRDIFFNKLRFKNCAGNGLHLSDWDGRSEFDGVSNFNASQLNFDNVNTIARLGPTRGIGHDDGAIALSLQNERMVISNIVVDKAIGVFNFEARAYTSPIDGIFTPTAGETRLTISNVEASKLTRYPFQAFIGGSTQAQHLNVSDFRATADMPSWTTGTAAAPNCPSFNIGQAATSPQGASYAQFNNVSLFGFQAKITNVNDLSLIGCSFVLPLWNTGSQLSTCLSLDNCKLTNSAANLCDGGFNGLVLTSSLGGVDGLKLASVNMPFVLRNQAGVGLTIGAANLNLRDVSLDGLYVETSAAIAGVYAPQSNYFGIDLQLANRIHLDRTNVRINHPCTNGGTLRLPNTTTSGFGAIVNSGKHIMTSTAQAAGPIILPVGAVGSQIKGLWISPASTLVGVAFPLGNTFEFNSLS